MSDNNGISILESTTAEHLVREVLRNKYYLLILNLTASLAQAWLEGISLGVVYVLVNYLSTQQVPSLISGLYNALHVNHVSHYIPLSTVQVYGIVLIALLLIVKLLQSFFGYAASVTTARFTSSCQAFVLSRLYIYLFKIDYSKSSVLDIGDLSDSILTAPLGIRTYIEKISALILTLFTAIAYLVVMLRISYQLSIFSLCVCLASFFVSTLFSSTVSLRSAITADSQKRVSEIIIEYIAGRKTIELFGISRFTYDNVKRELLTHKHNQDRQSNIISIGPQISSFAPALATSFILLSAICSFSSITSQALLPSLITFLISLQRLGSAISTVVTIDTQLKSNRASVMRRINQLLGMIPVSEQTLVGSASNQFQKQIQISNLVFRYADDQPNVYSDLSLTIDYGSRIALVGPSGCGKSTLVDILAKLYIPSSGIIDVDTVRLDLMNDEQWRSQLSVVSQDTFIFNASAYENIRGFDPAITLEDVKEAASLACCDDFVSSLKNGYQTILGSNGIALSGGQKQRISIARAIVRKPRLLILDESTSALDAITESKVILNLLNCTYLPTILFITHRLASIASCDQIYLMINGEITESGTHQYLLDLRERYYDSWVKQAR